jgi:hypothetical protein
MSTVELPSQSPAPAPPTESYSCDVEYPDPYYCEPIVFVSMAYPSVQNPEGVGTIGLVSCADALKFKSLESFPGDKPQTGTSWIWAYEDEVTLYTSGWETAFDEIHPKADTPYILLTYSIDTILETHPECKPPDINSILTPTSSPDSVCADLHLTPEECAHIGTYSYTRLPCTSFCSRWKCDDDSETYKITFTFSEDGLHYVSRGRVDYQLVKRQPNLYFHQDGTQSYSFTYNGFIETIYDDGNKCVETEFRLEK